MTSNMDKDVLLTKELIDSMMQHMQQSFRNVRSIILEGVGTDAFDQKVDGSPVTEIDKIVEENIMNDFHGAFPNIPIYGEETGYSETLPAICWLIDPIDGTASYIQDISTFTCMAVLIANEEALASVIYNPTFDTMYTAQKNSGAFKNGARLELTHCELPVQAYCKKQYIKTLDQILAAEHVQCTQPSTGAGNGFALVAEGTVAARFQINAGGYIHDYAPGALLVSEAGGVLIPLNSSPYTYKTKSFIACHPALADTLSTAKDQIAALEPLVNLN